MSKGWRKSSVVAGISLGVREWRLKVRKRRVLLSGLGESLAGDVGSKSNLIEIDPGMANRFTVGEKCARPGRRLYGTKSPNGQRHAASNEVFVTAIAEGHAVRA